MHVNRTGLDMLRKDRIIKRNPTQTNAVVLLEIYNILSAVSGHLIQNSSIEKTTNWALFKDLWLQNESGLLRTNNTYRNYTRGSIIMSVDWGTSNIGTEIRYPHPAVVLFDKGEDWIIAAPVTAAIIDPSTQNPIAHQPFEVLAYKQNNRPSDRNEFWFRKHSVIQVDQIQRISKYRAINKNSYKLKDHLLKEVENVILKHYIPSRHHLLKTVQEVLNIKIDEVRLLTDDLRTAYDNLESANQKIDQLNNEIKTLRVCVKYFSGTSKS